jgi:hypothetical protein
MRQVAKQRSRYLREDWVARIKDYHQDQFVFVDESASNQRSMDRKYGWSPINTPAIGIQALKREKRWSILPAYTIDGYLPGYLIHQGSITKDMFIDWLRDEVLEYCTAYPGPRSVLVMDNASIHRNLVGTPASDIT